MENHLQRLKTRVQNCPYSQLLGIELVELSPGYAKVSAIVKPEHHNFLGRTHGGWLMSLADQAFAIAGNTVPGNYVAIQFNIHILGNPSVGERVFAQAKVVHQGKTLGLVEMEVEDSTGKLLATASGAIVTLGEKAPSQS
jgi:acyl-CoA thioesterase